MRWIAGYALVVVSFVCAHCDREPYDDGHFFKRLSVNALRTGELAWNVDEGAVYGSTSQTFQWLSLAITALTQEYYMVAVRALSMVLLVLAFGLLYTLARGSSRNAPLGLLAAFVTPVVLYPLLSGMETTLAFALIALFLVVLDRPTNTPALLTPLLLVLVYLTRPDATLLLAPAWLFESYQRDRRLPWRELVVFGVAMALVLLVLRHAYGTALPLPFYAKQAALSPYDPHFIAVSATVRTVRFGLYLACAAPLFALALHERDARNLVLLGSVVVFAAYHYFLTIEVMGMHARFYAPTMPVLGWCAMRGIERLSSRPDARPALVTWLVSALVISGLALAGALPKMGGYHLEKVPLAIYVGTFGALALIVGASAYAERTGWACASVFVLAIAAFLSLVRVQALRIYSDEAFLALQTKRHTVYRGLDTLRTCFAQPIHVYHSEVGLVGLRFLESKVTDLAGLLSPTWLFAGRGHVDEFCRRDRPEAIFLPHKNYIELNRELREGLCLKDYRRVVEVSSSPLFVRSDLYPQFRACAQARQDRWASL